MTAPDSSATPTMSQIQTAQDFAHKLGGILARNGIGPLSGLGANMAEKEVENALAALLSTREAAARARGIEEAAQGLADMDCGDLFNESPAYQQHGASMMRQIAVRYVRALAAPPAQKGAGE